MKKRLLALLLVLVMGLSLAACSAPAAESTDSPNPSESSSPDDSSAIVADLSQDILTFAAGDFVKEKDVLVVNGYTVPTSLFLYWLAFNCSYFESNYYYYGLTVADYADSILADTCSMASYYALLEQKSIENGCPLTDEQLNTIKEDMEVGSETHEQRKELYGLTEEDLMFIYSMDFFYSNLAETLISTPSEEELNNYVYQAKHILIATASGAADGVITLTTGETVEYAGTVEEYNADVLAKAQDLYDQLVEAEKEGAHLILFDQLMNEHSQDGRDSEGNLAAPDGYTTTLGKMVSEFETAALALEFDHFSEPVKSTYGYHIILRGAVEDLDSYAEDYANGQMEGVLNTWLNEAEIVKSEALDSLDAADFYERYIAWQTAYVEENELVGNSDTAEPSDSPTSPSDSSEVDDTATEKTKKDYQLNFDTTSWYGDVLDIVVYSDGTCIATVADNSKEDGQFYASTIWSCGHKHGVKEVHVYNKSGEHLAVFSN